MRASVKKFIDQLQAPFETEKAVSQLLRSCWLLEPMSRSVSFFGALEGFFIACHILEIM